MFEIRGEGEGQARLLGRLDASQVDAAFGVLRTFDGPLTLDCSELEYISSAGLGVLIETHKRLDGAGHVLRLVHLTPKIRNVFRYAGLDKLLAVE